MYLLPQMCHLRLMLSRWKLVTATTYKYSLDYEANGVGGSLFDDIQLDIDGDPRTVTFLI